MGTIRLQSARNMGIPSGMFQHKVVLPNIVDTSTHHPVDETATQDLDEGDGEPVAWHGTHERHCGVTRASQVDLAVHLLGAGADALRSVVGEYTAQVVVGVGGCEERGNEGLHHIHL